MNEGPVRIGAGPLVSAASHASLGSNVNGPSLIRVPDWIENALGRYYLYFAHHQGRFIRLAVADRLCGPWIVHPPGVLDIADTPFSDHIASPDVHVDRASRRIVMLYHGCGCEENNPLPYEQVTCYADSADGLRFRSERRYLAESYLRVVRRDGWWYGFSGGADRRLSRSRDLRQAFEPGPRVEIPGETFPEPYPRGALEYRMRHVGLAASGDRLAVYYSNVGDCPERIKRTELTLEGDWTTWRAAPAQEVMRPARAYEGIDAPLRASASGDRHHPVHELRDPFVFEENGSVHLLYACAGEQGIALARLA